MSSEPDTQTGTTSSRSKPRLLHGMAVYQNVVLDGKTSHVGSRDGDRAWGLILPHLNSCGTILDVGSNFGWFGLQATQALPACVVASVEADLRSAGVQRRVLESNPSDRICLLTARAGAKMARRFATAGQRFDAVFCLAVLHWMADHRAFLEALAPISGRLFIELPDPSEEGAGVERIRREIGHVGTYLKSVFPDRTMHQIGTLPSPRQCRMPRELWMVNVPKGWSTSTAPTPGLDVSALMQMSPSWPERSWWSNQLGNLATTVPRGAKPRILFSADGLRPCDDLLGHDTLAPGATGCSSASANQNQTAPPGHFSLAQLAIRARRLPEHRLLTFHDQCYHRARRLAGVFLRVGQNWIKRVLGKK